METVSKTPKRSLYEHTEGRHHARHPDSEFLSPQNYEEQLHCLRPSSVWKLSKAVPQNVTLLGNGLPAGKVFIVEWASDPIGLAFCHRWKCGQGTHHLWASISTGSQPVTFRLKQSCHLLPPSPNLSLARLPWKLRACQPLSSETIR